MIQPPEIQYLAGSLPSSPSPLVPFDPLVDSFFDDLSLELLKHKEFPDIVTFAFWCRRANREKLKKNYSEEKNRLGLGLVFHIAPANVPLNFAFSFAFGLLSGNGNVVRVPSRHFPQVDLMCDVVKEILQRPKYQSLNERNCFVRYESNDDITLRFSQLANARIIWGGDETVRKIRAIPVPERSIDIAFADRFSLCVIGSESILSAEKRDFSRLVEGFYNDTFLMDQNACSSPNFVVWLGKEIDRAKKLFWKEVTEFTAKKYELEPIQAVDKLTQLCHDAIDLNLKVVKDDAGLVYRVELDSLEGKEKLRGRWGYFYEYNAPSLEAIKPILKSRCQTITYFGVEKKVLLDFVMQSRVAGVDRIVPVGLALDMGVVWDGYDLIRSLSRRIEVI